MAKKNIGVAHGLPIDQLIELVARHYTFDEKTYPALNNISADESFKFALNHSALHFSKTAGQLAAACESADHGSKIDIDQLRALVPKALINVLRLAELLDLNGEQLIEAIEEKYGDLLDGQDETRVSSRANSAA